MNLQTSFSIYLYQYYLTAWVFGKVFCPALGAIAFLAAALPLTTNSPGRSFPSGPFLGSRSFPNLALVESLKDWSNWAFPAGVSSPVKFLSFNWSGVAGWKIGPSSWFPTSSLADTAGAATKAAANTDNNTFNLFSNLLFYYNFKKIIFLKKLKKVLDFLKNSW